MEGEDRRNGNIRTFSKHHGGRGVDGWREGMHKDGGMNRQIKGWGRKEDM